MNLESEFYRLPVTFDVARLREEVERFTPNAWRAHPQGFEGNSAMILVAANGEINDDLKGMMKPTPHLLSSPYLQQVLASFQTVVGRSRLMRIGPQRGVSSHVDINYYWHNRTRVHVPIITHPDIEFVCNGKRVHMAAGEAWIFDNWKTHEVINPTDTTRIHLVFDTVGSAAFWRMVRDAHRPFEVKGKGKTGGSVKSVAVEYREGLATSIEYEKHNVAVVMPPDELEVAIEGLLSDVAQDNNLATAQLSGVLRDFVYDWRACWAVFGNDSAGFERYRALLVGALNAAKEYSSGLKMRSNDADVPGVLSAWLGAALNPDMAQVYGGEQNKAARRATNGASRAVPRRSSRAAPTKPTLRFTRPVFVVAAPRSGSTMLFEVLAQNRALWTIGGESHQVIEGIEALRPASRGYESNALTAADATPAVLSALGNGFMRKLVNAEGARWHAMEDRPTAVRFLEKTPKNALRIPFFKKLFPDAKFIYLHRSPEGNISSIIEAWRSGKFVTYPDLPGWEGDPWSLLLVPGWGKLNGVSLAEIAAAQWRIANETIVKDLAEMPRDDWCLVSYDQFLEQPEVITQELCNFIGAPYGPKMREILADRLPHSRYTLTPPAADKWRKNQEEIDSIMDDNVARVAKLIDGIRA